MPPATALQHILSSKSGVITKTERPLVDPPETRNSPERPPPGVNNCTTDNRELPGTAGGGDAPTPKEGGTTGPEAPTTSGTDDIGDRKALTAPPAESRRARRSRAPRVKVDKLSWKEEMKREQIDWQTKSKRPTGRRRKEHSERNIGES